MTIANNLVLTNTLIVGGTGAGTVTLNGILSGAAGLTKSATSPPTLVLGGINTFGGDVIVNGGALSITNPLAIPAGRNVTVDSGAEFRIGFGSGNNFGQRDRHRDPQRRHLRHRRPPESTDYHINELVQGAGSTVNFTGSTNFDLRLVGTGAGITVTGNSTWTGAGTSRIQNDTDATIDLSIAPGATLTSSIRLRERDVERGSG